MITINYQLFDEDEYRTIEVETIEDALEYVEGNDSSWEWSEILHGDSILYAFGS